MLKQEDMAFFRDSFPVWSELEEHQKRKIEDALTLRECAAGEMIHRGKMDCSGLLMVQNGQLRVSSVSESGKEITLYRLLEQDMCLFTASCVMRNINFEVQVQAEKPGRLLQLPAGILQELMQSSLPVSEYISGLISSHFSDVMWVMEQVLFMSFDRRLALFLLEQSTLEGGDELRITHEEIAHHLGTAREVVTRMLKYFQNDGLVSLSRGGVALADRRGLELLSQEKKGKGNTDERCVL